MALRLEHLKFHFAAKRYGSMSATPTLRSWGLLPASGLSTNWTQFAVPRGWGSVLI